MAIADGMAGTGPRLSQVLFDSGTKDFRSFATIPSNVEAAEAAVHFSRGLAPFVVVIGPSGWGKTHLLESAVQPQSGRRECRLRSASEWLRDAQRDTTDVLALDDVQEVLGKTHWRVQLRWALERRLRSNRPTLLALTPDHSGRQLGMSIPSLGEWIQARIETPDYEERGMVIRHLCPQDGLLLRPILTKVLARRVSGNGRSLVGALKRLRLHGKEWETPEASLKACGILQPYFADDGGCDLKDQILKAASRTEIGDLTPGELAAYLMQRVAGLSEADVSRFLDIRPSDAYTVAARVSVKVASSEALAESVGFAVERVLDRLADGA